MINKIKEIIAKALPDIDTSAITEETKLVDDLGFDSLAIMMMSMEIENVFKFKFTEFVKFETIGDVCKFLDERVAAVK